METRRPRVNIAVTTMEERWLRWYAGVTGRPYAEAAGRLLSHAIEAERAKPALEHEFQRDERAGPIESQVLTDIGVAFNEPGVVLALSQPQLTHPAAAARAARYLQDVSAWIADPRLPSEKGMPPRLATTDGPPLVNGDVGHAMEHVGKSQIGYHRTHGPTGAPGGSDKRQLSDLGAQRWMQRYAGRPGEEV